MDDPHLAEHRLTVVALLSWPCGLNDPVAIGKSLVQNIARDCFAVNKSLNMTDVQFTDQFDLVERLDPFCRGLHIQRLG